MKAACWTTCDFELVWSFTQLYGRKVSLRALFLTHQFDDPNDPAAKPSALVVARCPDGLGARLFAILNAYSLAKALDLDFCFVWPHTKEWGPEDAKALFDAAFLERFEIS